MKKEQRKIHPKTRTKRMVSDNSELAEQWHKRNIKKASEVSLGCKTKYWWVFHYDDPKTGKHFIFEWEASPLSRSNSPGCPFLSGKLVWAGFNDFASQYKDLAGQWHPKNKKKPSEVTPNSCKKYWWLYHYDDPKTGRHFDFEWKATPACRIHTPGCPFLTGKKVWAGFNDLASQNEALAKQWHPKNKKMPSEVLQYSDTKYWWIYHYDDPKTGKHYAFEWEASPHARNNYSGCPFLTGKRVWAGFNDLASQNEALAKQWHPRNKKKPTEVALNSNKKYWWIYHYDDPKSGKHFVFEWEATLDYRVRTPGCPFISGKKVWDGFNDLASQNEALAKQWHPRNKKKPSEIAVNSKIKYWWIYHYDDPKTGKHFVFEWEASPDCRVHAPGCPFLSGQRVWAGFNDLASQNEILAKQWHPRNTKKASEVAHKSSIKYWWIYHYDDPETGKHFVFEWKASPSDRNGSPGCPFLTKQRVWTGFNDLESCYPTISKQWHPKRNRKRTPDKVYKYEGKRKSWWLCPKCGHEWRATVYSRTVEECGCPKCREEKKGMLGN